MKILTKFNNSVLIPFNDWGDRMWKYKTVRSSFSFVFGFSLVISVASANWIWALIYMYFLISEMFFNAHSLEDL